MKSLVFATNNAHKVSEVQKILQNQFEILTLKSIAWTEDIPEPFDTLEENARTKSQTILEAKNVDCFSEDSGLFINGLNGEPGVYSARYAGENASDQDNINKVLKALEEVDDSSAYFKTIVSLQYQGEHHFFSGVCKGKIINEMRGENGFGYDPIFVPNGYEKTFAELSADIKNTISHRKKATEKLRDFLLKL